MSHYNFLHYMRTMLIVVFIDFFETKRVGNFIFTFHNTNENCFLFWSCYFPQKLFSLW